MDLRIQYELVTSSRMILLNYCKSINEKDFVHENGSFGRGSIRNLLVHIGNTYEFWIGKQSLKKNICFKEYNTVNTIIEVENYFAEVNNIVEEFISVFINKRFQEININIGGKPFKASPLKLFTHVITHEFHHKGQILSLSRCLGYTPVDTDVIR